MAEVKLTNVGPIEGEFQIALNGPGLYELRGSKGQGKTTVLSALGLIAGHKVSLTVHDGELSGSVSGFGVVAPVGSRKRPKGKCDVDVMDSERFDLVDLIDPDGKTAETRDAVRIKALATLCNLSLAPKDFHPLIGGQQQFERLGVAPTEDPVLFANRVKAAFDGLAKQREDYSKTERGHERGLLDQVADIDVTGEADSEILAQVMEKATSDLATLLQRDESASREKARREVCKQKLAEARAAYQGPDPDVALAVVEDYCRETEKAVLRVRELEQLLAESRETLAVAQGNEREARERLERAEQHQRDIAHWEVTLRADGTMKPTYQEIEAARAAKEKARHAQEQGVRIRDAQKAREAAERHKAAAIEALTESKEYRSAASQVFGILTRKLKTKVIRIENIDDAARLVVDHPVRGKTLYDKVDGLSDGERVRAAIDELLPLLKSPGLFPVPQRTYQDLPPADRKELAAYAREKDLYVFGAQVTDGELTVVKVQ